MQHRFLSWGKAAKSMRQRVRRLKCAAAEMAPSCVATMSFRVMPDKEQLHSAVQRVC